MPKLHCHVFTFGENRMLIGAFCMTEDVFADQMQKLDIAISATGIAMACGLQVEKEFMEVDSDNFAHIKTAMSSPFLVGGSTNVMLFEGPEFDKRMAAATERKQEAGI